MTFRLIASALLFTCGVAHAQLNQPVTMTCTAKNAARADFRITSDANPGALATTPVNAKGEHLPGLGTADFTVTKGAKKAEILDVKELTAVENTVMRVIFMVDNSQSMSPYLTTLRATLKDILARFSKAVRVSVIFFSEQQQKTPPFEYNGKPLPLVRLPYTADKKRATDYCNNMIAERLLSRSTYLYDGVHGTLEQIAKDTGRVDRSYAIVFSDGEDNASTVEPETILRADKKGTTFFTIDYLTKENDFLVKLARSTSGEHFQAKTAGELETIFQAIANKIVAKGYEVRYKFKDGPSAAIATSADVLTMEEDVVRETFPLLNYVFFDQGSAALPERYTRLTGEQAATFTEAGVEGGAMNFYYTMLNVLGSRMRALPASAITITGYVNETGIEKKNSTLALDRARVLQQYLTTVWGIEAGRIVVASGALPPVPSSLKDEDGRIENCRAEITSEDWQLLKPVTFVRRTASVKPETVQFTPTAAFPEGLKSWTLRIEQNGAPFDARSGAQFEPRITWNWRNTRGEAPASTGELRYVYSVSDKAGDVATTVAKSISVREVKRERNLNVTMEDGITKEKISLILFPFDVSTPGPRNERILDEYVFPRLKTGSRIAITGYTDAIGSEEYNLTLSQNRSAEVKKLLLARAQPGVDDATVAATGVGETSPLYMNTSPEGRFYNRTVGLLIERAP
ncbi:MAG: OmpA family protein [Ignavibacteria bacterium]|nr:OmpA family protein [Ignavibacteria bacterium]